MRAGPPHILAKVSLRIVTFAVSSLFFQRGYHIRGVPAGRDADRAAVRSVTFASCGRRPLTAKRSAIEPQSLKHSRLIGKKQSLSEETCGLPPVMR